MARSSKTRTAWIAWGAFGLAITLIATGAIFAVAARLHADALPDDINEGVVWTLAAVITTLVGALLALQRPSNPIGWLFLASSVIGAYASFAYGYAEYGLVADPGSLPAVGPIAWPAGTAFLTFVLPAVFVPLLFPDGRPPTPRWRLVGWAGGIAAGLAVTGFLLADGLFEGDPAIPFDGHPIGIGVSDSVTGALEAIGVTLSLLCVVAAVASLMARYRGAEFEQRQQLKWLALVGVLLVVAALLGNLITGGQIRDNALLDGVVSLLFTVGIPVAIGVAILRHQLYDIDLLLRRSFVYGVLWSLVTLAYIGGTWALGVAASGRLPVSGAILATVAVTLVFQPARTRLSALADRWLFGRRRTEVEIVADVGATLEPETVAAAVRQGLRLRWARVTIHPSPPATDGSYDGEPAASVSLEHGGEHLGLVECSARLDGDLRPSDHLLLQTLARQLAIGIHDARLVDELTASRSRLVQAEEAERRRIQRNLHDGAQQDLVALLAKARLAQDRLDRDPGTARELVAELQQDARHALRAVRELAQGIHPNVLTDRGLADAIEERAARLPLDVTVEVDPSIRRQRFSDEVEGAAFFAAAEGMTNIVKHASANHAYIKICRSNGLLSVEVGDDGCGFSVAGGRQRGLPQLADRLEALGGVLDVRSAPGQGTVLSARLPARERR